MLLSSLYYLDVYGQDTSKNNLMCVSHRNLKQIGVILATRIVLHRYLHFFLRTMWFYFIKWHWNIISSLKSKNLTQITHPLYIWLSSTIFSNFWMLSEHRNLNLKLCSKQYCKIDLLHSIVMPQPSGSRQHYFSTKKRQAGRVSEKYISFICLWCVCLWWNVQPLSLSRAF